MPQFVAVPTEQVVRIHASSGTTGKPVIVGYTRRDLELWTDLVARSLREAGLATLLLDLLTEEEEE